MSQHITHAEDSRLPDDLQEVVIGLGSNLGERLTYLQQAVRLLGRSQRVMRCSRVYETAPVGGPRQGPFLNAAVKVATSDEPSSLLAEALRIERALGRERRVRWGPRTVDLDLLWGPNLTVSTPSLVLPHPRLTGRPFALLPLLDVAPTASCPTSGRSYAEIASQLDSCGIVLTPHRLVCRWTAPVGGGTSRAVAGAKLVPPR